MRKNNKLECGAVLGPGVQHLPYIPIKLRYIRIPRRKSLSHYENKTTLMLFVTKVSWSFTPSSVVPVPDLYGIDIISHNPKEQLSFLQFFVLLV